MVLNKIIRPALIKAGIKDKVIGRHSSRHSLATNLRSMGGDVKVAQEPLRHANSRISLDLYTRCLVRKACCEHQAVRHVVEKFQFSTVASTVNGIACKYLTSDKTHIGNGSPRDRNRGKLTQCRDEARREPLDAPSDWGFVRPFHSICEPPGTRQSELRGLPV